jgi:hypothetical protein
MLTWLLRIGLIVLPWSSMYFYPKWAFKKYSPAAILSSMLLLILVWLSIPLRLWTIKGGIKNKILNDFSLVFGPMVLGTFWVFRFTYGKPFWYFFVNAIIDYMFAYPLTSFFQRVQFYKIINFRRIYIFLTFMSFAFIIYMYQLWLDKGYKEPSPSLEAVSKKSRVRPHNTIYRT